MPVPIKPLPDISKNDAARFWSRVDVRGPDDDWDWGGYRIKRGYGQINIQGKILYCNRVAYFLGYGNDPYPFMVLHTCDNPACCNPAHLFKGTNDDNMADMVAKGRSNTGDRNSSRRYPQRVARGERSGTAKLTQEDVDNIRFWCSLGNSQHQVAQWFAVARTTVELIVIKKNWKPHP